MAMRIYAIIFSCTFWLSVSHGAKLNGVTMADSISIDDAKLVLNGMGLREVPKFGFQIKVYVGGLYLVKKESDPQKILKDENPKRLVMEYVRSVDRSSILEGFQSAYYSNCIVDCEKKSDQFKPFGIATVSVREKSKMILTFYKDRLEFEVEGANAKKQVFNDPALSQNMLAIYIGKNPPTKNFMAGILGQ